jgi:DNA modification methylase
MENSIECNIKQLNAELARITKPKAYVQFYCDPEGFIITAYDRDKTDIDDPSEYEIFERTYMVGDVTEEEYIAACAQALSEVPSLLVSHGWSPEFHRLEDI